MVIDDVDIFRARIRPTKTNAPLIIDSDALLTETASLECLKVITGWNTQIIKPSSDFKLSQFSPRSPFDVYELPDMKPLGKGFGFLASE